MSEALDKVRDELRNGRISPNVVAVLEELERNVSLLLTPADDKPETPEGGK